MLILDAGIHPLTETPATSTHHDAQAIPTHVETVRWVCTRPTSHRASNNRQEFWAASLLFMYAGELPL
jgi:hypothetical protein